MAKTVGQIRYYGDKGISTTASKNYPSTISRIGLSTGVVFNNLIPITQLGVQTLPGMKIYINDHPNPIVVGSTGIYELNIEGSSSINKLSFGADTLALINNNPSAYLIIDYISEREG